MSSLPTHSKGQPQPIINYNNLIQQINKGLFEKYTICEKLYQIKDGPTKVYKAFSKQAQYPIVAIKVFTSNTKKYVIESQIAFLKFVQSDYFIKYIGLDINQKGQYGIFFPYIEIYDIVECSILTQKNIQNYMRQLLKALEFAHQKGIMHRDIKPMNILYDRKSQILKVTDLGLATNLQKDYYIKLVGTTYYMAPEILLESTNYNEKVDIWSAGIIFGQLIFGKSFFLRDQSNFLRQILQFLGTQECKAYIYKNDLNINILNEFQFVNYEKKNIKEIVKEISQKQKLLYSEQAIDLLQQMLILDPSQRISAAQALKHKFFTQQNK